MAAQCPGGTGPCGCGVGLHIWLLRTSRHWHCCPPDTAQPESTTTTVARQSPQCISRYIPSPSYLTVTTRGFKLQASRNKGTRECMVTDVHTRSRGCGDVYGGVGEHVPIGGCGRCVHTPATAPPRQMRPALCGTGPSSSQRRHQPRHPNANRCPRLPALLRHLHLLREAGMSQQLGSPRMTQGTG